MSDRRDLTRRGPEPVDEVAWKVEGWLRAQVAPLPPSVRATVVALAVGTEQRRPLAHHRPSVRRRIIGAAPRWLATTSMVATAVLIAAMLHPGIQAAADAATQAARTPRPVPAHVREIHVRADGSGDAPTIAAAVAAARPGDWIRVAPGMYRGGFTVTEDITIDGQGPVGSIIVELDDGPGVVLRRTGSVLRGLTVRAGGAGAAIVVDGGSPTLTDLRIRAGAWGLAIDLRGETAASLSSSQVTGSVVVVDGARPWIHHNVLRSVVDGSVALDVAGSETAPLVEMNEIVGQGPAVVVRDAAAPTVHDNDLRSLGRSVDASSPAPAVWFSGGDGQLSANRIEGSQVGLLLSGGAPLVIENVVRRNGLGVGIEGCAAPVLEGNRIDHNRTGLSMRDRCGTAAGEITLATLFRNRVCDNRQDVRSAPDLLLPIAENELCDVEPLTWDPPSMDGIMAVAPESGPGALRLSAAVPGTTDAPTTMVVGRDGVVWLATATGRLWTPGEPSSWRIPVQGWTVMRGGQDGRVWIGGPRALVAFDGIGWTRFEVPEGTSLETFEVTAGGGVLAVLRAPGGLLTATMADGGWSVPPASEAISEPLHDRERPQVSGTCTEIPTPGIDCLLARAIAADGTTWLLERDGAGATTLVRVAR